MSDDKELAATKAEDKQIEKDQADEAARKAKALKSTTVDKDRVKAAVSVVMNDGANQHQYPYLLVGKVLAAIDDPEPYLAAARSDGRVAELSKAEVREAEAQGIEDPEAKPAKKAKETKAERVARLNAARAAAAAKKKQDKADAKGAKSDPTKLGPGEKWDATAGATKEAAKQGVDMAGVEGTGAGGTVTKSDVTAAAENK